MKKKLIVFIGIVFLSTAAFAATRTWDGGGTNSFWSNPTNWVGDIAPVAGDTLSFPVVAARKNNTNDLVGFSAASIQFATNGYTLYGNSVAITSNVVGSNLTG